MGNDGLNHYQDKLSSGIVAIEQQVLGNSTWLMWIVFSIHRLSLQNFGHDNFKPTTGTRGALLRTR